jgi:dimethylsulfone monooxygenase
MAGKKQFSKSHDERAYTEYRQRFAGGAGSYPLVGTPERIAETIAKIAAEGWSGAALSFLNYTGELPFFIERVFPLLAEAGLKGASHV